IDHKDRNFRRLVSHRVLIDTDDYLLASLDSFLILVGRILDLALRKSFFDRRDHAAHRVDLAEVLQCFLFHLFSQRFEEVRTAEWIDCVYEAGLFRTDLLGVQTSYW